MMSPKEQKHVACHRWNTVKHSVRGWCEPAYEVLLRVIVDTQYTHDITGDLLEIGVYFGRSFVPLLLASRTDETVLGVDLFAPYEEGVVPPTPKGVKRLCDLVTGDAQCWFGEVDLLQVNSHEIDGFQTRFRIAHVDGDHSYHGAAHDLMLARNALHQLGVLIVDDVWNIRHPDVTVAVIDLLRKHDRLVPIAAGAGKIVLCNRHAADLYRAQMTGEIGQIELLSHPVYLFE